MHSIYSRFHSCASYFTNVSMKAISEFEYVEPTGKDVGINIRIKVETILALLNDKEKIQAIRDKRVAPQDKYGLEQLIEILPVLMPNPSFDMLNFFPINPLHQVL